MKIEHYRARSSAPELTFEWRNLLGVCRGEVALDGTASRAASRSRFHCDAHRGLLEVSEQELHVDPTRADPDAGSLFGYTSEGEIRPARGLSPAVAEQVEQTISRLNLNISHLKRNRREVRDRVRDQLAKKFSKTRVRELVRTYETPNATGQLAEFCEVALQALRRKL